MKKILPILLVVLAVCAGCSTTYKLTLTNGDVLTAHGKPAYNAQQGIYYYKDINGQARYVFAAKVREIAPVSMADKGNSQFLK